MENQARYDLNAAVEIWRQELAAQPHLTAEVRRELETHLRDAIAGFQQRGLNDEESFWLACKRVGQPQQLDEEFVKANPNQIWRERVFWMVLACLGIALWGQSSFFFYRLGVCFLFGDFSFRGYLSQSEMFFLQNDYLQLLFSWLPIFVCALFLAKGWAGFANPKLLVFIRSRLRVALITLSGVLINCGMLIISDWPRHTHDANGHIHWAVWWSGLSFQLFGGTIWPCLLITLLVWLMPPKNRKMPKRA